MHMCMCMCMHMYDTLFSFSSSLVTSPASSPLFLSGMESVSAGSVQAITGAIIVVLLFGERSESRPYCL